MFRTMEISENEVLLEVSNDLIGETATDFHRKLEELPSREKDVVVDLSQVKAINSSCIGKMLLSKKKLSDQGKKMRIGGCSMNLYTTFKKIKFTEMMDIEQ